MENEILEGQKQTIIEQFQNEYPDLAGQLLGPLFNVSDSSQVSVTILNDGTGIMYGE